MTQTSELPIILAPAPYRRNTAVRHRRSVTAWQVERSIRYVRAWLAQPVRATRAQHATVAVLYGTVAVSVAIFLAVVMGR